MREISPETVGGAMRLAMAVLACKPTTLEQVFCVAECATGHGKHIARATRFRDEQNVVTEHVSVGVTLCGAACAEIHPYQPPSLLTNRSSEFWSNGCADCASEWLRVR